MPSTWMYSCNIYEILIVFDNAV